MGKNEFFAWAGQLAKERREQHETDPHSWRNEESDPWWREAREKRRKMRGR